MLVIHRCRTSLVCAFFVVVVPCLSSVAGERADAGRRRVNARGEMLDMTYAFNGDSIYWPTGNAFKSVPVGWGVNDRGWWYASNDFGANEHGGTHVDAPIHFSEGGKTIDKVSLLELFGPVVKIDVSLSCAKNRDYLLTVEDVERFEKQHGRIPPQSWVVMYTGIGTRFYPDRKAVLGTDMKGEGALAHLSFPGFGVESIRFLLVRRDITGVAIDTPSVDYGKSFDFSAHRELCGAGKVAIENIANADKLPAIGARLFAVPMLIEKGTGAPARIIAFLPEHT